MAKRLFAALALAAACAGCRTPTEVVLVLDVVGTPPPTILVKLHRSTPFADDPTTPAFVTASLDGADLDLIVTPQGAETKFSLLPAPSASNDLLVTVSAGDFAVMPSTPQMVNFTEHSSKQLRFTISAPLPDGGAHDAGVHDAANAGG
jgi:hypothetical protein